MKPYSKPLKVLAVDDVPAALADISQLLQEAPEVGEVKGAGDAITALKMIQSEQFDAVFLDISMPGLDGLELASLLAKLNEPPVIVFVTAYDGHAVTAYGIGAVDYLLKPVRAERLSAALAKVVRMLPSSAEEPPPQPDALAAIPVESGGRTRYVRRSDVAFVEAHGDHVRLHTPSGVHAVRMPISRLEEYWEGTGFVRTHRSFLVALKAIKELRSDAVGGLLAHTELGDVPVSRRHARELRERLLHAARAAELDQPRGRD
ncbi:MULTISPECIES: LytTR family DNA-binding domain-containing protein [Thermocrispum]|jgi:DNA-binding LytR/AlgR family response regulator|uniref:DNA-binding response regulator n=1 Tax=Thermocrispum agreste TaxID=37925 RepID=A0A2W4JMD3_9PSEU|nr:MULTISPECIES: LytTR family DNA-binding domain-containing protein [Thermocrispum]PZM99631.1 MAG: DNA-binding response regulator [Thermocrispum agreste]